MADPRTPASRRPRRALAAFALALVFGVLAPAGGAAQLPLAATAALAAQSSPSERSPLVAGLLQAALPPLPVGYLYAGNVARGLIPTGIMVVGTSIFLVEAVEIFDWTKEGERGELLWLGWGMTLGGYVFGIVDAANVARNRNARLRSGGVAFRVVPSPSSMGLAVTIPVR